MRVLLETTGLATGGEAFGRDDSGRVVFVAGALAGEQVVVEILEEKKRFARGRVIEVVAASPERIAPTTPEERRQARQWAQEARWKAALEVLAVEVSVIFLAGRQLATWQPLSDEDDKRLALAVQRVRDSREVLNGRS